MLLAGGRGAIEEIEIAAGDGEADAEASGGRHFLAGALDSADEGLAQCIDAEALGEAEFFGGCGETIEVSIGVEYLPGSGIRGPDGEHGFKETDGVLEARIEGGNGGGIALDEGAVQENGGHGER